MPRPAWITATVRESFLLVRQALARGSPRAPGGLSGVMPPRASNSRGGLVPNLDKVPSVTAIAAARRSLVEQAKADRGLRGEHHSLCSALPPPQPVTVVAYESPSHHHHLHLARVSGGGDHESLFRVTSTEVQETLLRLLGGCLCNGGQVMWCSGITAA